MIFIHFLERVTNFLEECFICRKEACRLYHHLYHFSLFTFRLSSSLVVLREERHNGKGVSSFFVRKLSEIITWPFVWFWYFKREKPLDVKRKLIRSKRKETQSTLLLMESASVSLVSLDSSAIPGGCLSSSSDINDPINYALNEANEAITLSFGLSVNYGRGIDVILLWIMLFFSLILVTDDTVFYSFVCQPCFSFLRVVIIKLHPICSLVMLSF